MSEDEKKLHDLIMEIARQSAILRQRGKMPTEVHLPQRQADLLGMDIFNGLEVIPKMSITSPRVK